MERGGDKVIPFRKEMTRYLMHMRHIMTNACGVLWNLRAFHTAIPTSTK